MAFDKTSDISFFVIFLLITTSYAANDLLLIESSKRRSSQKADMREIFKNVHQQRIVFNAITEDESTSKLRSHLRLCSELVGSKQFLETFTPWLSHMISLLDGL
jgi:hypothetical protein